MSQEDWNEGFVVGFVAGCSPLPASTSKSSVWPVKMKRVLPPLVMINIRPVMMQALNFGNIPSDWFIFFWNHNHTWGQWTPDESKIVSPTSLSPVNLFPWEMKEQDMIITEPSVSFVPVQLF